MRRMAGAAAQPGCLRPNAMLGPFHPAVSAIFISEPFMPHRCSLQASGLLPSPALPTA